MWFLAKLFSGTLFTLSLSLLVAMGFQLTSPEATSEDKKYGPGGLIFLGGTSGLGAWMFSSSVKAQKRQRQSRLMASFFELIRQEKGKVSPLLFSMKTGMNGQDAKTFLDERSSEFGGRYDVTENGDVFYVFESLDQS
jgi:hypothetical protein